MHCQRCSERARPTRGSFLIIELIVTVGLVSIVLTGVVLLTAQMRRASEHTSLTRQLRGMAEHALACEAASAANPLLTSLPHAGLRLDVVVRRSRGDGAWAGLDLVQATATAQRENRPPLAVTLSAYLPAGEGGAAP